ncbi:protein LNK1-like [Telopea speciosissima]|uniref:protein LNK1-like n=1 Tax=Telopea speciosissima TaxID=54955 RepID=UPI001CC345FF|nr:protein LNK1-like [Telopea speciosissima]
MLDWSTYELEGTVWDEFSENDDHLVPYPGGEEVFDSAGQVNCHKKPRHENASAFSNSANGKYAAKGALHRKDETSFATVKDQKAPMPRMGSWSCTTDGVFPASCDTDSIKGMSTLTADGTKLPSNCFNSNHIDFISNEFCANDPILGNRSAVIGSSLCHFPLGDISSTGSDLEFFANVHEDKENSGHPYYGWPDIGNFEDVDKMFRNCDSTFGYGIIMGHDDELSCFSSSSLAIDGSEDAMKSGLKSSLSDSNELRSTSEHHEPDLKFVVDTVSPVINYSGENSVPNNYKIDSRVLDSGEPNTLGHKSYVSWSNANAENREQSVSIKQINLQNQQLKQHNQSEEKIKKQSSEFKADSPSHGLGPFQQFANVKVPPSVPSYPHVFPSLDIPQQQQNVKPNFSSYSHRQMPYIHPEYKDPSHQVPVTPTSSIKTENNGHPSVSSKASSYASNHAQPIKRSPDSSPKASAMKSGKKVGKPFQQQQLHVQLTGDPQYEDLGMRTAFTSQVSTQKYPSQIRDEVGAQSKIEGTNIVLPAEDSSIVQQSSCMSSALSVVVPLEETSFQQLQYIMEQLDIRTKLCIRDSLYRLARSAEQRHNIGNLDACSRNCSVKTGVLKTEESNKCTRFMDMETDTNPIDRSLAHLLFHKPSDVSTMAINDVLSQESHAMLHWSISTQPAMSEKLVCPEEVAGGAETELHTEK